MLVAQVAPGGRRNRRRSAGRYHPSVNRQPVDSPEDVAQMVRQRGDRPSLLQIRRNQRNLFVPLR